MAAKHKQEVDITANEAATIINAEQTEAVLRNDIVVCDGVRAGSCYAG